MIHIQLHKYMLQVCSAHTSGFQAHPGEKVGEKYDHNFSKVGKKKDLGENTRTKVGQMRS